MKVYVVCTGAYTDRDVAGVYASVEAAQKAHPIPDGYKYPEVPSGSNLSRPGGWHETGPRQWYNGLQRQQKRIVSKCIAHGSFSMFT